MYNAEILNLLSPKLSRLITDDALMRANRSSKIHTPTLLVALAAAIAHGDEYAPGFGDSEDSFELIDPDFLRELLEAANASDAVIGAVFGLLDRYSVKTACELSGAENYLVLSGCVPIPMNASDLVGDVKGGYTCPYLWILTNLRVIAAHPFSDSRSIVEAHSAAVECANNGMLFN